jgi:hypothetical protein
MDQNHMHNASVGSDRRLPGEDRLKGLVVWTLGTVYVLLSIAAMATIVWAADNDDNSANPTHWVIGAAIVLAPMALFGAWHSMESWSSTLVQNRRAWITIGVAVGAVLIFGAQEVVADASACTDDDCARVALPIATAIILVAWSLPLGLSMLRRARYPAPLLSAGVIAVLITASAALVAGVQATLQEDDYADLTLAVVVLGWMLPSLMALAAVTHLRNPVRTATRRSVAARRAAELLVAVGFWFIVMPFAADVDDDSLPIILVLASAPGIVLFVVGLVHRSRR